MDFKHFKGDELEKHDFGSVHVKNIFSEEGYDKFSLAEVNIVGNQKFGLDQESDTAYYVLEGEGKFFIEDKEINVKKEM